MRDTSSGAAWGLLGLVVGFLIGSGVGIFRAPPAAGAGLGLAGIPDMQSFVLVGAAFVTLWIVLIAVAIRWLFNPRGRQPGRLADLPADFDDWHRRAHAQMEREAATIGTRP
jgi:hypothetical protein